MRTAKHAVGCNVIAFCFVCNGMTLYPPISVWPSVRHNFLNFVLAKYAVISFENFICATLGGRVGEKMRIISPFIHPELLNACNNCWIDQHTVWLFSRRFKDLNIPLNLTPSLSRAHKGHNLSRYLPAPKLTIETLKQGSNFEHV